MLYLSKATGNSTSEVTSVSKTILALKKRLLPNSVAIPLHLNRALYALQEGLTMGIWLKDSYTMLLSYGKIKLGAATLPDPPAAPPNGGSEDPRA